MIRNASVAIFALLFALGGGSAAAQSTVPCGASPPAAGATIRGPVLQVIDAYTVCVALGPLPEQWLAVRLNHATAHRSGAAQSLFAQTVVCKVISTSSTHVRGACQRVEPEAATSVETSQLPF